MQFAHDQLVFYYTNWAVGRKILIRFLFEDASPLLEKSPPYRFPKAWFAYCNWEFSSNCFDSSDYRHAVISSWNFESISSQIYLGLLWRTAQAIVWQLLCFPKKSRFINESSSTLFAQKSSENARTIQLMEASEFAVLRGTESAQLST